jgi:hypothetical protein
VLAMLSAGAAYDTIESIMKNPEAPWSVRLKAALAIVDKVTSPPPPVVKTLWLTPLIPSLQGGPLDVQAAAEKLAPLPASAAAQSAQSAQSAQTPPAKTGRNDLCPCGSGKKFKRCCANKGCEWLRIFQSLKDVDLGNCDANVSPAPPV